MHIARRALLVLIFFAPLPLVAQYASDAEKGFNAGQAYDTSDFDAVNVWTGNLVVNIPIISYPQRGKVPSFGLSLVYNGKSWQEVQPIKTQEANWKFTGDGVQLAYAPAYGAYTGHVVVDDTLSYYYSQIGDSYGTIHDYGGGVAMDGSGLVAGTGGVRDRNGILYGNWGAISDPDGNTITPNLSTSAGGGLTGWTDTVGRFIPAPSGVAYLGNVAINDGYVPGVSNGCQTTSFPGQSGGSVPIQFCYSTYTAHSDFQQEYVGEGTGTFTALSSVSLPNGTSWGFSYNSWGDLASITLPTGGVATYQWQTVQPRVQQPPGSIGEERAIQTRTLTPTPGSSTGVTTSTYDYSGSSGIDTVKVTNLAGDYVLHSGDPETEAKYYDHALGLLKTVDTTYAPIGGSPYRIVDFNYSEAALPETITTTLPSGQVSKTCIIYDNNTNTTCVAGKDANNPNGPTWTDTNPSGTTHPIVYGSELYRYEYDYGQGAPGPLLRATQHVYEWQAPGSPYLANNVLNAECLTTVYGPGTAVPVQTSCAAPALQSNQLAQTISGYDENNGSPQGALGNLTSVTRWLNTGTSVKSQTIYNSQGMPWKKCDPIDTACANPTIYTYDGTGLFPSSIQYPTTIAYPAATTVQHIENFTYDKNTGELSQHIDQNNQPTGYTYDSMRRLHTVTFPTGGGSETYNYSDTTPAPSFTFDKTINSNQTFEETGTLDGLGRKTQTQITSDPGGAVIVDTGYDNVGRVHSVSNPYRSKTEPTYGSTTYQYDGLDRKTLQTNPDSTTESWSYNGSTVTFTDEDSHQSSRTSNAAGNLVQVLEPNSSGTPAIETDYEYDGLNNLVKANQLGLSTETARARTFAYDSLSRLTNACNPESNGGSACTGTGPWSASYTYDANGNTHTKATLYPATETNYYDALNRLYESTHSDQTPSEQFTYDLAAGISGSNSVGHVVAENLVDPGGKTLAQRHYTSFDTMGRLLTEDQCSIYSGSLNNCGTSKTALSYTYDLAGNVITSGSGANVPIGGTSQPIALTYTYDSASHLQKITSNWIDSTHPGTLFNAPSTTGAPAYSPFGGLLAANLSYSNATQQPQILLNRTYDIRGRAATAVYSTTDGGSPAKQSAGSIAVPSSSAEQSTTATGSGTITISGSNASCIFYPAPGYPQTFWDAGNITVVVNGVSYNAGGYGGAGITPAQIAAGVASGMNGIPSAPVTATSQGGVVTLVAKPGSGTLNYSYSVSVAGTPNPPCTTNPPVPFSVSPSSASFTSGTVYDSGTITVFVNGSTATATYGQGSTAASVASAIQSAVQSAAGSFLTAGLSGDTVSLSSNQANSSTNWPVSVSVSYNSAYFSHASFPVSSSGMSGGANAQNVTLYSYNLGALSNGKHGYDSVGNVTGFQDTVMGEWNFGYDHLNRLDLATGVGGTYNGGAIANQTISWIYDSFGNRKNQTPSSGAPFPTEWANYGASNRITGSSQGGVGYNGPGAVNADGINNYTLDSEDRVCNWVTQITGLPKQPYTNVYDAGGHRVAKGTVTNSGTCEATQNGFAATETTILGQGGEQVTALGPGTSWAHTNVYADGQLLATYDAGGLHFALNDWLGTKRMQVTAAGGFENSWQSLPFGDNPAPMAQGGASDHHFTGQLHDNESQLDYFQARFYSSTLGRFQSPDWSGDAVPVPYANLSDPQSLNLYAYVRNNPISKVDADGHLEKHFSVGGDGWGVGDGWPAGVGYGRSMHNLLTRYNASLLAQAEDFDIENELRREPWDEAENALKPVGPDQQVAPEWPPAGAIYPERGEKGPLDALERSKDFTWYVRWKTKQETTLYRMWGDPAELTGKGNGTYYSLFPPERSTDFMRDQMSLPSKWNSMENLDPVKFPAGTTMYVGPASAQAGFRGGGFQVFVPKP